MVAIALLSSRAMKPSPVCLMDEVDAPLDEANGERFNTMLKEMSTQSQFIVITHNKKQWKLWIQYTESQCRHLVYHNWSVSSFNDLTSTLVKAQEDYGYDEIRVCYRFATETSIDLMIPGLGVTVIAILVLVIHFARKGSEFDDSDITDGEDSTPASETPQVPVKRKRGKDYHKGLQKSRGFLAATMDKLFGSGVDEDILEELEETLLMADVGIQTTSQIIEQVRKASNKDVDLKSVLKDELLSTMSEDVPLAVTENRPYVIMMVGVNGSGKTTTIGKLHRFVQEGKSVMVAAGDTFRAGAIEQLQVCIERVGAEFILLEHRRRSCLCDVQCLDAAARDD